MLSLSAASLSPTNLTSTLTPAFNFSYVKLYYKRKIGNRTLKAELTHEAPVVVAIGGCIINSVVFPVIPERDEDDEDEDESPVIDSTDARMAVMGIICLIPYFNWLSWVFAWLDTGKQRYLVYALVYLAPYLKHDCLGTLIFLPHQPPHSETGECDQKNKLSLSYVCRTRFASSFTRFWTNLSISPQESWLPIASIFLCIIHMQLEASVRNGDLQWFQLFRGPAKNYSVTGSKNSPSQGHDRVYKEEHEEYMNLPSARDRSTDIQGWGVPEKPSSDLKQLNDDED